MWLLVGDSLLFTSIGRRKQVSRRLRASRLRSVEQRGYGGSSTRLGRITHPPHQQNKLEELSHARSAARSTRIARDSKSLEN